MNITSLIKFFINYITLHRVQLTKFTVVGFVAMGVNFLSFHVFYGMAALNYKLAASLAYTIAVIAHFSMHRIFTFQAVGQEVKHNIWKYLFMLGINYLNVMFVMWVFVDILKCSPYVSLVAPVATSSLISFFMMKYFVFEKKQIA